MYCNLMCLSKDQNKSQNIKYSSWGMAYTKLSGMMPTEISR